MSGEGKGEGVRRVGLGEKGEAGGESTVTLQLLYGTVPH